MEQGDTEPRNEGSLRAGKDREKGPPLEPPEGMQSFQHTDFFFFFGCFLGESSLLHAGFL